MQRRGLVTSGAAAGLAAMAALALSVTVMRPAAAQQDVAAGIAACRGDVKQFCAGVEPGAGRLVKCLGDNAAKLTPACADVVRARTAATPAQGQQAQAQPAPGQPAPTPPAPAPGQQGQAPTSPPPPPAAAAPAADRPMQACRGDVATLCKGIEGGGGKRLACLRENRAKVTPACGAALDAVAQRRENLQAACRDDVRHLCSAEKGAQRRACLEKNADALAPACRAAIAALPAARKGN
ncbi:MAG: hypothetical protein KGP27_19495 [Hyphomicrobiales bacterium]|nr:hypothetical protein [Hyphomicrobiales bacterium]